tara:strand:+ start:1586 stop:2980 length:1395 start_codon:yes stop_codon:yes gene_type:complete
LLGSFLALLFVGADYSPIDKSNISVKKSPNFIFYLSDDQDQMDYGTYGNPKINTLNVDKLAKEGILFTNFYTAQAICSPSRSQIFTGMYPVKNGCMANHIGVKPNIKSIATHLKKEGYEVVLAGKSHVKPNKVFNWTYYFGSIKKRYLPLNEIENYLKNVEKPFCLFLASDFPHGPYPKNSKYTKTDIYKLPYHQSINNSMPGYYKNIEDDDKQLGAVLKLVDKYNFRNNSLFIYASDHGKSGKWGLEEQGLKVPFIVRWPGHIVPNTKSDILLSLVDVLPTFLEALNSKIPDNIDGKSFYKALKGNTNEIHEYIYGVATKQNIRECKVFPSRMVRGKRYKLIKNFNSMEIFEKNMGSNKVINEFIRIGAKSFPKVPFEELYDLKIDPFQKNNLAKDSKYKKIKSKLSKELKNWMIDQNDFLLVESMPLIKPSLHPLDKNSKWNKVNPEFIEKLTQNDYIKLHY